MKAGICIIACIALCLSACGEIKTVSLVDQPERARFGEIRDVMLTVGCSGAGAGGGCHSVLVGDLQVSIDEPAPAQLEAEFLQVKSFVNIQSPADSPLLTEALPLEPITHQVCFHQLGQGCGYQKILSWIAGEPSPDCEIEVDSCFL